MTFRLEAMVGSKGCKKAIRYEDPKGKRDWILSGISTAEELFDPLPFVQGQAGQTHTAFGKLFPADAGSSAFLSDSSLHRGSFLCTIITVLHLSASVQRLNCKLFNTESFVFQ